MKTYRGAVVLWFFCFISPMTLLAHVPYFERGDTRIDQSQMIKGPVEKSIALYGHFLPSDVDAYTFVLTEEDFIVSEKNKLKSIKDGVKNLVVESEQGEKARKLYVSSVIPGCSAYENLRPMVAVVGPEQAALPRPDVSFGEREFPFPIMNGQGMMVMDNQQINVNSWYEKYTRKWYYLHPEKSLYLTRPGRYHIYIWEQEGREGDYALAVGDIEVWGIKEKWRALRNILPLLLNREVSSRECRKELRDLPRGDATYDAEL